MRSEAIKIIVDDEWSDIWFFPEYNGVKGYLGTEDITFLGLNPSTGASFSEQDKLFYDLLKDNGFANAHITDWIRRRISHNRVKSTLTDMRITKQETEFLRRELDILKPIMVVKVGKSWDGEWDELFSKTQGEKIDSFLRKASRNEDLVIETIIHYSPLFRNPQNKVKLTKDIIRIRERYASLKE